MHTVPTNPLNLPEMQFIIGAYLNKIDLVACILVCKSWSHTFGPLLYSYLNLRKRAAPPFDLCCTYASHVHNICFDETTPPESLALNFSNLSTLSCSSYVRSRNTDIWVEFIQRHHMSLKTLEVGADLPLRFWESLAETSFFPELREISIEGEFWGQSEPELSVFQYESAAAFWKACTRFKAVSLTSLYTDFPDMDRCLAFKYLESLELAQLIDPTIAEYMALLSNCPRLQHLFWHCDKEDSHEILEGMAQLALSGHLQCLRSLDLNLMVHNTDSVPINQSMMKLLNALKTPLKSLYLNCGQDMEETTLLQAVQRHGRSLNSGSTE
ncbi:hypothetical protein F5H01DRAFT_338747 [Linnemannia elongata]|nr:hypothetical protein F5H01DRAFT_338747 [Linnemannia elongata]